MVRTSFILLLSLSLLILLRCTAALQTDKSNSNTITSEHTSTQKDTTVTQKNLTTKQVKPQTDLSSAATLMLKACDNYIKLNPNNPKVTEVLILKASLYYNKKMFTKSREICKGIIKNHHKSHNIVDAVRLIAQSFYQENRFTAAQEWYRKLKDIAQKEGGQNEAQLRIAESIFRIAEKYEKEQKFNDAATQYNRIAMEFPKSSIADIATLNEGIAYEKLSQWQKAILTYQRLRKRYKESKLAPKSLFRHARCYEKIKQWEQAAHTYVLLVNEHPRSDLVSTSLNNAGFCFENINQFLEAAKTYEKLALLFPNSEDAADILFKASELYGKINDWEGVTRVNKEFSRRYGSDKDRIVQVQCMIGVALFMQAKYDEAINQLNSAVETFGTLDNPSTVNKYYSAKAQFTLGKICHHFQNEIELIQPQEVYKNLLAEKSEYLDKSIEAYSKVIAYKILEWTPKAIYQIGQSYEDFALGVFKQERPKKLSLDENITLEMSIAKVIEEYFVDNALSFHEENVKIGIKEKIENKTILNSKKKLTYLPYVAGENYLSLIDIAKKSQSTTNLSGFALITHKFQTLQKIAPFQECAIALFLTCLEIGSMYQEFNDFYQESKRLITKTSYTVAETYEEIGRFARSAPIPKKFDPYEEFVYKTKLLKQIEEYDENALSNYMKVLKFSQAYKIKDEYVQKTMDRIAKLLFIRARCYDLLYIYLFNDPPYPTGINESEKAEYRAQFEEIALSYQDHAIEILKTILDYAIKNYASGEFVKHAYVRLYQINSEEYGFKSEKIISNLITTDSQWKCSSDSLENWFSINFNDKNWDQAVKVEHAEFKKIKGFPKKTPVGLWNKNKTLKTGKMFFRRNFYIDEPPHRSTLHFTSTGNYTVYINEIKLVIDSTNSLQWDQAISWDLKGKLRKGKNVIALEVSNNNQSFYGIFPYLMYTITSYKYLPKLPNTDFILEEKDISEEVYVFPYIKNFSPKKIE